MITKIEYLRPWGTVFELRNVVVNQKIQILLNKQGG